MSSSPVFVWQNAYSVGDPEIDRQHQKLVAILNDLTKAMLNGKGDAVVRSLLDALVRYTLEHFTYEEQLLRQVGFPRFDAHVKEHRELSRTIQELQERANEGKLTITIDVMTFLKNWLRGHILGSDMKYAAHIRSRRAMYESAYA